MKKIHIITTIVIISFINYGQATGLNFWETSSINTALASSNGSVAQDASVLALNPSAINGLKEHQLLINLQYYNVTTKYNLFNKYTKYTVGDIIPSAFFIFPINEKYNQAFSIYSRTAADINIPQIFYGILFPKTHVQPIVLSQKYSLSRKYNDNLSFAWSIERLVGHYLLEQKDKNISDTVQGFSGDLSVSFKLKNMHFGVVNQFSSHFSDKNIEFKLPNIVKTFIAYSMSDFNFFFNYSFSNWKGRGVFFDEYKDPIGLLKPSRDSHRYALALQYLFSQKLHYLAGVSIDSVTDNFGGHDVRYRLGSEYHYSKKFSYSLSFMYENYVEKYLDPIVSVKNTGWNISVGIQWRR